MNHSNGRLILKVKKRRSSIPAPNKFNLKEKENITVPSQRGKKRANPFSRGEQSTEKLKVSNIKRERSNDSAFLSGLENCDKIKTENLKENVLDICSKFLQENNKSDPLVDEVDERPEQYTNERSEFPLDWAIRHKVRFFSVIPFEHSNIKAADECKGIYQFTSSFDEDPHLSQTLYNWIHPTLPCIPNFPLKTKTGTNNKDKVINILINNKAIQESVMKQWRTSFQSLFNMLKTEYCPYFYLCSYQFTILFKAAGIGSKTMSAVMGPTTKGLRDLLTEEGISFEFIHEKIEPISETREVEFGFEDENENNTPSMNTSYDEEFLDSIGLNKKEHFPRIEQQDRISVKNKLRMVDNRPESTIKIRNCQGLFNFLLNATFLCAPSGIMLGVPPTLISPSPFEDGTLSKCRISGGQIKHQKKSSSQTVYCVDVSGMILPGQFKQMVDVLTKDHVKPITIHTKTFDMLHCLNEDANNTTEQKESVVENMKKPSFEMASFLNQNPVQLSDNSEICFSDTSFKFN